MTRYAWRIAFVTVALVAWGLAVWMVWPLHWYRILGIVVALEAAHASIDIALAMKRKDFALCSQCHNECHVCRGRFGAEAFPRATTVLRPVAYSPDLLPAAEALLKKYRPVPLSPEGERLNDAVKEARR